MAEYIKRETLTRFRNEVMDKFIDLCRGNDYNKLTLLRIGETIDSIFEKHSTQPTADVVEVVHGEWEYYNGSGYVNPHFRCTNCGQPRYEHYACNDFKYCPNCGAKMDGKGDA